MGEYEFGIAENLKLLRKRYGITQQELAEIAGVTNSAVSAWETGAKEPRMGPIERISRHFNIKKSNLIEVGGMEVVSLDLLNAINEEFLNEQFSKEEIKDIIDYIHFIKAKRK